MPSAVLSATVPELDLALYPRTYRVSNLYRLLYLAFSAVALFGGFLGAFHFATGHDANNPAAALILIGFCLVFVALGVYLALFVAKFSLVLAPDAIELHNVTSTRTLRRDQIAGRRLLRSQNGTIFELIPRDKSEKKLKISMMFNTDAAFQAWFAAIPDLDPPISPLLATKSPMTSNSAPRRTSALRTWRKPKASQPFSQGLAGSPRSGDGSTRGRTRLSFRRMLCCRSSPCCWSLAQKACTSSTAGATTRAPALAYRSWAHRLFLRCELSWILVSCAGRQC